MFDNENVCTWYRAEIHKRARVSVYADNEEVSYALQHSAIYRIIYRSYN